MKPATYTVEIAPTFSGSNSFAFTVRNETGARVLRGGAFKSEAETVAHVARSIQPLFGQPLKRI